MNTSGVIKEVSVDPDLDEVFIRATAALEALHPPPEKALVGDIVLLLAAPLAGGEPRDGLNEYERALGAIFQGARWQQLRRRLFARMHQPKLRAARRKDALPGHEAATEQSKLKPANPRVVALEYLTCSIVRRLTEFAPAGEGSNGDLALEAIGHQFNVKMKLSRDKSEVLADDHALLMAEFGRRGYTLQYLPDTLSVDVVNACLGARWEEEDYDARQLEIVHLPGDEEERLPGELFGVRGVTVKTREDQLREILPAELAPWFRGPRAKQMTLDKIVNRAPLIFEHFTTTRPLSRHRVLVTLIAGAQRLPNSSAELGAEVRARLAVFHLLFALTRKVPRDQIQVDVALFTRDRNLWSGAYFPLEIVPPRDQAWRNILELDELLPTFFAVFTGRHHTRRRGVESFGEVNGKLTNKVTPAHFIARALTRGMYRGVLTAAFGREPERGDFLPPQTLPLPPFDAETPLVLLGTVEDGRFAFDHESHGDAGPAKIEALRRDAWHDQAAELQGRAFSNLLSAHLAPLPLPQTTIEELSAQFLEMVIGPLHERTATKRS